MTTAPEPETGGQSNRSRRDRLASEPATEVFGQTSGIGIAVRRVLFEAFETDHVEVAGHQTVGPGRRLGNG